MTHDVSMAHKSMISRTVEIALDIYDRPIEASPRREGFSKGLCHAFRVAVASTVSGWEGPSRWFRSWTQA
jgi:hypothetical protein